MFERNDQTNEKTFDNNQPKYQKIKFIGNSQSHFEEVFKVIIQIFKNFSCKSKVNLKDKSLRVISDILGKCHLKNLLLFLKYNNTYLISLN